MSEIKLNSKVSMDLEKLIDTRLLVQANSGGGKSWLLRRILEQSHGKVQQIVIDLEGEFSTLREKYDYILASKEGDIPAEPRSAALLARKILELNVSTIVDLYELSHYDRKHFVRLFLDALINAPKKLWHPALVVVDEAHVFCMSEDTEILTQKGWKGIDEVKTGEWAIAYDPDSDTCSIKPVERVIKKTHSGDMFHLKNQDGLDCLVTPNHRVVCKTRTTTKKRKYKYSDWKFVSADKLPTGIKIPTPRPVKDMYELDISHSVLRILGWIVTDGNEKKKGGYLEISQATSNPNKPRLFSQMKEYIKDNFPQSSIYLRKARKGHKESAIFYLGVSATKFLRKWLGEDIHRIPRRILIPIILFVHWCEASWSILSELKDNLILTFLSPLPVYCMLFLYR